MVFRLAFKNINNSFISNKSIYILLIVSEIIAVVIGFFVYGIFTAYSASMQEVDIDSYAFEASFVDGEDVTWGRLKECIFDILDVMQDDVDYVFVPLGVGDELISTHSEYYDGEFFYSRTIEKNQGSIEDGRYFNEHDYKNGSRVVYGGKGEVGDKYIIDGEEYEIIGKDGNPRGIVSIPLTAAKDDMGLYVFFINFKELPTQKYYETFKRELEDTFGENVTIKEFAIKDVEQLISIRSIIAISVVVGVTAALDIAMIYGYIIEQRRKMMAVYTVLGAKRSKCFIINQIEIMLICIITTILGCLIFKFVVEDILADMAEVSVDLYSMDIYIYMSSIYLLCVFVITNIATFINTKTNIVSMLRGAKNV